MYNLTIDEAVFSVVDLETTGLNPKNSQIIEIAALKVEGLIITDKFNTLVKPTYDFIPLNITKLTGITNAMVIDKPKIDKIFPEFLEFIEGSILVAHNANFDVSFLKEVHRQLYSRELTIPYVCTQNIAKRLFPDLNSKSLSNVASFLGVAYTQKHRAMSDALATFHIFKKMVEYLQDLKINKVLDLVKITNGKTLSHSGKRRRYV
ncbi:MAG: exonuclease domain-containing protein [Hydrogenothermaceae bacterium]|nr:exonuclease domain-containing protein [Hydrogenothermaceae bacterium]